MKKQELKDLIKPIVKECIQEALIEEGVLSTIVSEVAKGMQSNLVVEQSRSQRKPRPRRNVEDEEMKAKMREAREAMKAKRQSMMDTIGRDSYNGVDLFEGTEPLKKGGNAGETAMPSVLGEDPSDAGVDISSLMGGASRIWKEMK